MLGRVLVANRGEIACRIIRTLDRLGVESVAVYSDAERDALHTRLATKAVRIGEAPSAASYLSGERILAAAEQTGVDGVHPGYGFLAEDADFATAVERAGLAFVGPTPAQLRTFGAKDRARAAAVAAGVPLLPGSSPLAELAEADGAAAPVGFPLLVKSVAGGGGIGMVECRESGHLHDAVERAVRQSTQLFGSPFVFLERLVPRARHVEVQVFGDGRGRVCTLGERDCSVQRRRQKVVEESPAPHLDDGVRAASAAAAESLLAPASYRSAGTVEFVVDTDTGEFFFLEVNTRLQVEHGVTESVTGIDLVEWMVRLAGGDAAFLDDVVITSGHSIEARVYAEDPAAGFRPSVGVVTQVHWPPSVRVDTWVERGTEITPHYDPLLAKIVVHGPTRADAAAALADALDEMQVFGIETNRELLRSFVASEPFAAGDVSTTTLEAHEYVSDTVEVLAADKGTTVQDAPGRRGYWHVGVPPSGPMDDRSFRLGNRILGNTEGAPGLECTGRGPTLRFRRVTRVCLAGARTGATLDGEPVSWLVAVDVPAGAVLAVGAVLGLGLRTYVLVEGGVDVPRELGSASTFTLGGFGGHAGRDLRAGDVLHLPSTRNPGRAGAGGAPAEIGDPPQLGSPWELAVTDGPHGAPDFFTDDGIARLYASEWRVHHQSSRTGVRLVGPRLEWARPDGGEAGLHPSNVHDTPYTVGAVDFTGDMPIVLGPDGPSLGGFTCPLTVVTDDFWKLGQLAPGDIVRFVPAVGEGPARAPGVRRHPTVLASTPAHDDGPSVTYRRQGDRAVLVEYGSMVLDFDLRLRAHALAAWLEVEAVPGVVEATPGIRSLQVQLDPAVQTTASMLDVLRAAERELPALDDLVVSSRIVHLPLSWDDPATREAIERYMRSVRDDVPWCPWNIEFIRRINGLDSVDDVRRIVFDAEYLVLGLGDVYLGVPVAVPVDPCHRLVTTKYNPARTWTPENAVGIGGAYLCVYGMEGPGGYQFVGRTVPVWSRFGRGPHTTPEQPWLLRNFDRIRWYPVGADDLLDLRVDAAAGRLELSIEDGVFSRAGYHSFLEAHAAGIASFREGRERAFDAERQAWAASGELDAAGATDSLDDWPVGDAPTLGPLPDGAFVVEAPLHACVVHIHVDEGARVGQGDSLLTLEAMKMETRICAPVGGTVQTIVHAEGRLVAPGAPLVVLVADG